MTRGRPGLSVTAATLGGVTSAKTLLTYAGPGVEDGAGFRIGGVPLVLPGFLWPRCGRWRWADGSDHPATHVLGSLGGTPAWLQDEEVPECYSCLRPMGFVAQLEEGPGLYPALNFGGGGRGYAFACASCGTAFLWQC
jgi:hypothetical protein